MSKKTFLASMAAMMLMIPCAILMWLFLSNLGGVLILFVLIAFEFFVFNKLGSTTYQKDQKDKQGGRK